MNCKRADELFIDYFTGELGPTQAEEFEDHLQECPQCAAILSDLTRIRGMVEDLSHPEPSDMAVNRILAHAREEAEKERPLWGLGWFKILAPLCLMAAVGGLVVYQLKVGLLAGGPRPLMKKEQGLESARPNPTLALKTKTSPEPGLEQDKFIAAEKHSSKGKARLAETRSSPAKNVRAKKARPASRTSPPPPAPKEMEFARGTEPAKASALKTGPTVSGPAAGAAADRPPRAYTMSMDAPSPEVKTARRLTARAPAMDLAPDAFSREGPSSLLLEAEKTLEAGWYKAAAEAFSGALRLMPPGHSDRPRALLGLARALEGRGDLATARNTYQALARESATHRLLAERKIEELTGR